MVYEWEKKVDQKMDIVAHERERLINK